MLKMVNAWVEAGLQEVAQAVVAALAPPLKYFGPIGLWLVRAIFGQLNRKYAAAHAATNADLVSP